MENLLKVLKEFSKEDIEKLESFDRQYKALEKLHKEIKNPQDFLKLVVINALMSYQLQMKGEKYWETFSEFFSESPEIERFEEFIKTNNKRFLNAKLKRLHKVIKCVKKLFSNYSLTDLGKDLTILVKELSKCLNQKIDSKTVVFAAKMFMYGYRIAFGKNPEKLEEIAIPIDSRLSKISSDKNFWKKLSEKSRIPQIRLDAVLWIPMGLEESSLKELPEKLKFKLRRITELVKKKNSSCNSLRK
ncbi:DNA-(apurinic or apyrimidinic site) lyase [Desulfurobacterium thermolithotrophum DSM 11699]|uniref:DNA-(Apurinic or apyrimidinic site) lyase n=1 Tax=Desulfurobacterium thermolithotrophum (strain DSM 11699 / BSA) TaxID=868864 RepID=F0S2D2_DESTD|nr:N-glycosylase/DNA lyase [Desulfurobacterium thermolithotrophum]ADY74147.1 DNA-(apurinic or apyrimidinic site) lyase [Desulfurobacterium thermolithotrophum DSM 11699]